MNLKDVMNELESMGSDQTKKVLTRHGAREPFYGVKVGDLKKILRKTKQDHALAMELYQTGNSDAMYLAGLMADADQITKADLQEWVKKAYWYMISEYTVAWLAADSPYGWELGLEWIESDQEGIASAGWATLANVISIRNNAELDLSAITTLLERAEKNIHQSQNRVRYTMNGFIIAVGSYIPELTSLALQVAETVGKVDVNVGETSCKVPLASSYIKKMADGGYLGKKRKQARC